MAFARILSNAGHRFAISSRIAPRGAIPLTAALGLTASFAAFSGDNEAAQQEGNDLIIAQWEKKQGEHEWLEDILGERAMR